MIPSHRGHCRCGSVVLAARGEPDFAVYCHCDDCRRATGAPVLASVGFSKSIIEWEASQTLACHTIGTATRLFCRECGSPVGQEHESKSEMTFINTGFMDDPEAFPPKYHTFAGHQISWLELNDDLPRVDKTLLIDTQ